MNIGTARWIRERDYQIGRLHIQRDLFIQRFAGVLPLGINGTSIDCSMCLLHRLAACEGGVSPLACLRAPAVR